MKIIKGTSVSKGIAFGYINVRNFMEAVVEKNIADNTDYEINRFFKASADTLNLLQTLYEKTLHKAGEENAKIFSVQQMMLQDSDYIESVTGIIKDQCVCAEYAVQVTAEEFSSCFLSMEDEMCRAKSLDVIDISQHIIRYLTLEKAALKLPDASNKIIVADSYVPSHIIAMRLASVNAVIAINGMRKSHSACLARNLEIPSLFNVKDLDFDINGKFAAVNGFTGEIIIEPDEATIESLKKLQSRYVRMKKVVKRNLKKRLLVKPPKTVKLIAVDLDGTIISHAENISQKSVEAINKAADSGITVVVCTGRVMGEIPDSVKNIEGIKYFITSNGSSIVRQDGYVIYSDPLESDTADKVLDILSEYQCMIDLYIDGNGYMQESDAEKLDYYNVTDGFDKVLKSSRTFKKNIRKYYADTNPRLEKINLFFADKKERKEAICRLNHLKPPPKVAYAMDYNLEITSNTCCKGQGLQYLCDMLNADRSEVMAIGDSNNDISMLKSAGISVAMGNASNTVKTNALHITDTCENDGAAKAIEKYALKRV